MKKNQTKNISVSLFFLLFFFAYCNYVLFNNKLVDNSIVSKYTDGRKNFNFLKEHHGTLFELYRKRKLNFTEIVDQVYILENGRNSLKSYEIYSTILKDFHLSENTFFLRFILHYVLCSLFLIIGILIAVAFFTLLERKVMAAMQRRKGPNVVGFWGLLQPLADGLKLLAKEIVVPKRSSVRFFLGSPLYTFFMSLLGWCAIPWSEEVIYADPRLSALYVFAVSSLGVYGVLLAGWSSNSKYAFLGGLRSAAQMISYEVSLGFILVIVGLFAGTYNLREIIYKQEDVWYCFPMFPLVLIFFVSMLAETNRAPFDLPEAEAELVSGYNTEYSSIVFAMFFLGEYSSMLLMAAIMTIFFFGGWYPPMFISFEVFDGFWFFFKVTCIAFFYVWVRATLPRYRYNQLMSIGWKIFLPITFGLLILYSGLLLYFDGLPVNSDYNTFVVESILNLREKKGVFFELREYYIKFRKKNP